MKWSGGSVTEVEVLSKAGKTIRVKEDGRFVVMSKGKAVPHKIMEDGSIEFSTLASAVYTLTK